MPVLTRVVLNSRNAKVGKSACVYRTQTSCPATCPLMGSGCYGENKAHGGQSLFDVPARNGAGDYADVLALIERMPRNGLLRLNVVGDFLAANGKPDAAYIDACNASRVRTSRRQDHCVHARLALSLARHVRLPGQRFVRDARRSRGGSRGRLAGRHRGRPRPGPGRGTSRRSLPRRAQGRHPVRHMRTLLRRQAHEADRLVHGARQRQAQGFRRSGRPARGMTPRPGTRFPERPRPGERRRLPRNRRRRPSRLRRVPPARRGPGRCPARHSVPTASRPRGAAVITRSLPEVTMPVTLYKPYVPTSPAEVAAHLRALGIRCVVPALARVHLRRISWRSAIRGGHRRR